MANAFTTATTIVLVVVVLIGGGAAAGFLYFHNLPASAASTTLVSLGDNVTVNYIGIFGSGPEQGKVFDTSLYSVATNNIGYPKSLSYHARGSLPANYTPLAVHVGNNTPQSGYSLGGLSFIQVVTGFWQGLIGLPGNQSRSISVPPSLGYGPLNQGCVATKPITYTLPVVVTLTGAEFNKVYPGVTATTGAEFSDPHYHWSVVILSANATFVTVENLAHPGWTASPAGWPVVVTNVTSTANGTGAITLVNEIYPSQAGLLQGKDFLGTGPCSSQSSGVFIVTS
ncbi:MAG: FKBP-type peptidyl-prolyl cis-trans isomerase, partial [Thermoplasmata archaeon]|nr:FKBP-type peptidyl-prolyl cis-trans isomerase [Thermoplasmata archaeon]